MKVLVTGGAGFIGSHTSKALKLAGYEPICYDNLTTGHAEAVKWGPLVIGDILDKDRIRNTLRAYQPEGVIHFAASAYVGESVVDPAKYYLNNVVGTHCLLEAMREEKINRVIFSSTCATYGNPINLPIDETHPQLPISPYGFTKWVVERMLCDFDIAYQVRSISLRYFNASGADPEGELGECHDPETHLIPLVLQVASGRKSHLEIHGTDYDTADGTCIRDYVHVSDLAEAHVLALKKLMDCPVSRQFNLGTGVGHSVRQIIRAAEKITGRQISFGEGARREGDPPSLFASNELVARDLGWRPKYPQLEPQILHAWRWLLKTEKQNNI